MAERPLYTLYKNLKAQNYDVPDDYNKFEIALTRDGKSGADNRHAIYENLKAQNFDVPDTYERFYTALFVPRSRTSSRAKGGSVPMSAADRARFSAGAAAISASAKQIVNNAGRYNRLKQRKQKQQNDFGRVNLGTHLTPFGGDSNNVVKDEFAYNPETGKAGAYVTSDNKNVYSLPEAEQSQAHDVAYQQAVDAGEIPSVFDVRDKNGNYDLQENIGKNGTYLTEEGAQKQFDKKLADAYARKKEIESAIAEDHRLHGNPLLSYSASIGASNGRTAEQSDYSNKLATSLALVKQQIGALEAVKQYPTSSWDEDALKALDNTAFTAKTWDFGLTDFATMGQMERIKTKMDNNIPLSGSDKMLLKSKLGADAAAALEDEKMGNIYRWTKIAGQSLPFMADFFLTGGYGGITKGISRGALKFAAKRGMSKVSAAILKNTGIVAGDVIGSYAMAGTEQAMKTGADIMQRHLGNLYQDENGDYKFGTFDENGNLLHEGGESMGTALYKGLTSAMVENYTEKLFGHNYGIKKGAVNFMEKHGMNASAEFFKNIGKSGWYTNSKKWMEKFGINGFGEEVMEEEIGIPLHALLDGDNNFSDLGDAKQQLDIIGGMAISVGSMYAMGAGSRPVKGIYNRAQYYRFRNKVNVADNDAQSLLGDNWADIKDKIDNATNEQMGSVLSDILRQRDTMTKEQINAAVNYGVNLMKMRGYNIAKTAEMNAKEIANEPTTPEEQHQADIDNAYSEGRDAYGYDTHEIQLDQEDKQKSLAQLLGISEQQLVSMSDENLEALSGRDDNIDRAIYDYQLSSARYQGVVDDAQDKVDLAAHQAAQRVDMYTDRSRGSVRNATIKASGGAEDYGVYIISGNIATNDDGSIDVNNSDDMILYYDPTTNSVEHADALMFAELGEELPADAVKAQAVADAKENAIKEVAGIIDGTVDVGSQFSVTDADGTEHTYEVLADNGDGTAMITIDGNVPTELVNGENVQIPYSFEYLQKMKDLEDQKRLEAAKTEREQMEKERAGQETEQTEGSQPSFDFNQILNDNGNVVLVDVLGKDGNTKYPNSKLFLIRDAGAKAKVVELKSDGTLVPHAVNKEDVRATQPMSLDEYKQAFTSSMIEDNSGENRGEIEAEPATIEDETTPDVAENTETTAPADETAETPSTEQTPAITLEDGTIVPMLDDGNPDFSKLTAAQTAELYDTEFGEDADGIVSGYVSDAKKALDRANNMTVKGKTFVEQKASKDAKEKAIADAQAAYDSAIAIRDAYNERQLAKVEDTAEGRKNLIEKARRKFARLKSSVKDDAEAVAQIYKDTVGSLLHRLYDGTGIDVTDTIPLTAEEYVASNLGAHSLNYEGTETSKSVKQETGLSREDFAKTQLLAADGKGTTIDALVHSLWENRPSNLDSLDTQDIRNALIGVLTSGFKASEARSFIENIRIAQAEKLIEEERTAAENAAYYEQQKAKEEEEKKKAELEKKAEEEKKKAELEGEETNPLAERVTETDEEVESDGKYGTIYNKVYLIDGDKRVTKVDEPDANGNYTGSYYMYDGKRFGDLFEVADYIDGKAEEKNFPDKLKEGSNAIEVPEDATDEKPLGEQLDETNLPFSAKDNGKQQTTAERAADVEKNKVDDMKVVDNIVGKKTRKTLDKLAKMMGANVQWQYSDKNANGWFDDNTNTIYLTLDSSITEGVQFIFGHEMTHEMRTKNPAAYDELKTIVKDMMGEDAFNSETDRITSLYNENNVFYNGGRTAYEEEVVADQLGKWIRDANYAHTLLLKMSHPLLARLHEIVNRFLMALHGIEVSDDMNLVLRSIEQAYVKTANGQITNSETGEDVSFSLRKKPEPKKKGVGYKVFVLKDGKLYPPMVANPDGDSTPVGVWLDADAAPIAGESKTGRPQVKQGGKGTQGGSGKLAYRPGWHLGVVPYAIQFNRKDADGNKTLFPKNFVFAEVEYAADVDYQEEARQEGINPSGKYQHSLAGLKHLPTDGYYMYRTNPNPDTDPWVITGAMKVNRILTRAEQAELVKNAGREPQQIQEGDIVTDDVVNSINQEIADTPKFSLKVYHGSGADFTEFDFDHMGEGAGSQVFGWGGYVTSSEKIARGYTSLASQSNGLKREELKSNISRAEERLPFMRDGEYKTELKNEIKKWQKELANLEESKNLYEVDIPEDNGSNYLDWDASIPSSINKDNIIKDILDNIQKQEDEKEDWELESLENDINDSLEWANNGEELYKAISLYLGDKTASKLLASLGYTGIKYKAGRNFGGAEKGDTNYVIFKPEDMKITEHTKFSLKSKPVRFEAGKKLSDEEKKEVLSTLKDAYKVNGVSYHIEETAGGKEKRVYEPTADSYVVSDITNRPLRYYITLPDGRVAHPTEVYPNISDNEVKSSATNQGLLDDEADQIVSSAIGNMKDIADNAKAVEVLTELQNLPHETHDVGYGMNNAQSYNYKTGIFTSDAAQAIDYVVRRMRRKEDVPAEIPAALKKAVADSYGMVDNLIDGMSSTKFSLRLKSAIEETETNPSDAQKESGNFKKGHIKFGGYDYTIENPKGSTRSGKDADGKEWKITMHDTYGYIRGKFGKDGDHLDMFINDKADLDNWDGDVFVVDQVNPDGSFDEHKVMYGYNSMDDAEKAYLANYSKGWKGLGNITGASKDEFDKWLDTSNRKLKPFADYAKVKFSQAQSVSEPRFSLKDEKTMFGMHNISLDKLRKAIKQGGFAAPSMGVVDSKNGIYSDYGEITLIPKAEKLAKRTGKNAGTFTADAWTPTYPQVERIMNKQGEKVFNTDMNEKLGDVDNGIYSNIRESWKGYLSSGDVRDGLYWHYLFDKGMNPETIYQTGKYDNDITNEVMRISDNGNKTDYTDKEVAELIQLMNKATGKDNDVDAQREKLKARIASAEKQGNHLLVALKKKRLEELEGVENFYIAADFVNDVVRNNRKNGKVDVHDTMMAAKKKVEDNKKLSDEFPSWLDKKTEEYGVEEMLYNGTTASGNPKYIPNTIDNAVKLMKKQGVAGGYTAFGSELGVFIAKNSPEVNTLADMKNAKDKLIPFGDERHNQIKDKITKEFLELSDEIRVGSNNRYAFDDSGVSRMVELTDHKGNEKEFLKKAYNVEVSDEWMDRYNKLLDTIKKDYKVFYFETKFMRPYGLDEFEKAIVPSDTPSDVVDALKMAGIDVRSYERGNAEDRQKVTMDAINSSDNIRFSLRYDKFEHDLNQWKKDNNLPKDAQRPTIPQRNVGESAVDFLRRVDEYRKQMALWKTAPTYEQHLLSDDTALGEFNRELQKGSVLKRIAFQDSMLAIRKAQEAIMKEVGVDRLNMAEDAYTAENRSHGKGKNEFEEYNNEFLQPLRKAYHQMKKVLGDSYDNVRIYMMAKHGLERDAQMAFKKSLEADYEDVAQRSAAYKAYKGDMNRIINDSDLEFGRVDFTTWRQRDNALRAKYSPSYMDYRYDKNGIVYDYSGLSALFDGSDFEEAAYKLVKDIEDKYVNETHDLWDATNAATKKILRDGYKAGMMSKDTYQYVRDMYSHYIPLRGWDGTTADQVWDYIGGGNGAFNQTLKTAHGRTSIADDPIAYIENMAESGILLNNKNWVKQHLMLLAQNHPTSLLTLSKAWYVKSVDANGNEEWIPATPQITSQMNSNQVKAAIDAFEQKMEQMAQTGDATQKRDGFNIAYPQTHSEEREHEVRVMKDGEEYVIYVNGDPQLAQAMNNTRAHRVSEGIKNSISKRVIAVVGRKMAAAYTSLSPLFIPSNYFRDLTMTLASTAIREDAKYNYLLRKNLATSWNLGFMLKDYQNGKLRDKVSNGNATQKEQMFYDFMMNGGETGFVSSLDVEDLKKKFKNDLKDLDRWKANPVKVGHTIMDSIEFLNRAIEDSNRFAIYMTSIQYGRSIDEAVNDAKNVTLNFNRKGTGEHSWQTIRNLYLFINPAVQSLQTLGALAKHHPFKFTAVTASWLASGVLVPIVNAALMQMAAAFGGGDGDDDKEWYKDISKKYWQFTKWDRRNNLIMWVPFTHEFIKIPLAQEFRAFYGVGDMIASKMMGGELAEQSWEDYGWDLLGQVVDMLPLDPTGYDGNILVSICPNAIRPIAELAFNVDFTGKPLFKDTEYNKYDPNFTKAYVGTPDWLVRVSKMVNSIGNDYPDVQQNSIDAFGNPRYNLNNPAVVDHVLSSYLGGAYTIGSQVLGLLTKSLNDPKEIKVADIPLFSKFVSNPDDRPVTKKQGDEFWNMKENHDRAANTLSKLKKQAKVDGDYSMLERFYGSEEYKQYKQDDVKVKKYEEDKKKERAEESGEEYRPHKLNAEDIYKAHATPKDDFEDLKLKQLYTKLNGFKSTYDLLVDTAPSQSDDYYNANKTAIDAIDEISLDKQEISELKKGFLDDGKDAYNTEDMKRIRELRKKILYVLEKANKVVVANQKANAKKK